MAIHMDDVKAFLTRKVFGIPVGVFVLIFAAVVLYFAIKMKKTAPDTTADPTADTAATGDGGQSDPTQQPDFTANAASGASQTLPTVTTTQTTDTNAAWRTRAIAWLITQQMHYPTEGATAPISIEGATVSIDNYLNSVPLNPDQTAVRDMAVAKFGFPPEGIPNAPDQTTDPGDPTFSDPGDVSFNPPPDQGSSPPNIQPSPAPVSTPIAQRPPTKQGSPPCTHKVVNAYDNSATELAHLYFGETSNDTVNKIHEVNVNTPGGPGGPWAPGTRVNIPSHINPSYYTATSATKTASAIASKNGISTAELNQLNPSKNFPVNAGTQVRVK